MGSSLEKPSNSQQTSRMTDFGKRFTRNASTGSKAISSPSLSRFSKEKFQSTARSISTTSLLTFNHEDEEFTPYEIAVIRGSFENMKRNRDDLAVKLLQKISAVEGATECYGKYRHDVGNSWSAANLGTILLGGIERCLLRLDNSSSLKGLIARMTATHRNCYNVPAEMLVAALQICQAAILEELETQHRHRSTSVLGKKLSFDIQSCFGDGETNNNTAPIAVFAAVQRCVSNNRDRNTCQTCAAWNKFFRLIIWLFSNGCQLRCTGY